MRYYAPFVVSKHYTSPGIVYQVENQNTNECVGESFSVGAAQMFADELNRAYTNFINAGGKVQT